MPPPRSLTRPHQHRSVPPVRATAGTGQDPRAQAGEFLTTAQGVRLPDTDHSLKAGPRGPSLLEDFHLREKITHFDHERIPERVVHARGAAAHGVFEATGTPRRSRRRVSWPKGVQTPVFVRFSTVLAPGDPPTRSGTPAVSR